MHSPAETTRKSYAQFCTVSTALDLVGDRWTLLILRELLGGPARFQELLDGLPGIARNLLTERLRRLESDGLVRRVDTQYAVTALGAGSRSVIEELGFWGTVLAPVCPAVHQRSARAIAMAMQAILTRAGDALPAERVQVELEIEGERIDIALSAEPTAVVRLATDPDLRVRAPRAAVAAMLVGQSFDDAAFEVVSGDPALLPVLLGAVRAPFARLSD